MPVKHISYELFDSNVLQRSRILTTKIYRTHGKQPDLPKCVPVLMFFDIIFEIVMLIMGICLKNPLCFVLMLVGFLISAFFENFFNWNVNCYYELNNILSYHYFLNGFSVSDKATVVEIEKVDSFKFKALRNKLEVKGKITKKMPLREKTVVKKATLQIDLPEEDRNKIIAKLEELKNE